jgi:polyhydroxybutyrate depolymerase
MVEPMDCPAEGAAEPGMQTHMVQANERMRSYVMYVPQKYTGMTPVPVVFDFHGYSSSAAGQLGASGFRELADQEGFVAVYPEGVGASWHVNGCCGQALQEKLDEIEFVRAIWADIKKSVCIDAKRVYASGISQGGGMAHHVGCLAADIFAAVAPVSSDIRTDPCAPARPITEISFRGTADSLSPYEGGHVGPAGMDGYEAIGAKNTLEKWKTINMCTGTPVAMNDVCETYTTCAGGSAVSLCSLPGANHILYQNSSNISVPKVAWELFKAHPLP